MAYDFNAIESRWQQHWADQRTFCTPNPGQAGFDAQKPKFYVLDMFPYPSGVGLHVGHPLGYIATDIIARYKRMKGFNVLHPMGYDAFGLPAEQFAVEHGVHPRITTQQNIANMTRQLKRLGLSYDWERELATTDEDYFRWTQWIFLQLFNSWYDPQPQAARPVSQLIQALDHSELILDAQGQAQRPAQVTQPAEKSWQQLDAGEKRKVIDNHRLAYLAEVPVNWCPRLGTVLANEEVTNDGRSERGNHPVFKRPLKQWMLRITAYGDRLDRDLDGVKWPEAVKLMQRNWVGRSEGALVHFSVAQAGASTSPISAERITVFTTRPDTLFGATYMVLAPEHPLVNTITRDAQRPAVLNYQQQAAAKSDVDRQTEATGGHKTGVFTGAYAINPVNQARIPIWIADYVMMGYGTGAIMAVPAHDQRDHDFATTFALPIVKVISTPDDFDVQQQAWAGQGVGVNSTNAEVSLNGLAVDQAKQTITAWLAKHGLGEAKVQYKLRDWLFSRQRYWGEPFPILHGEDGEIRAVTESELPVRLPEMSNFQPTSSEHADAPPQPPLSRAPESWKHVVIEGKRYTREFNTMPQWAGSCWYYLRFLDPKNCQRFVSAEAEKYWMSSSRKDGSPHVGGVDLYVGGVEHAVLHLLYARFWHKVLFDLGYVSTPEPFGRLFNQGYIQAHAYTDARGMYVNATEIEEREGGFFYKGQSVKQEFGKMGKSLKNAIAPDEVCEDYGCDTLRLYEMYLGPLDQSKVWRTRDIVGVHRFLQRVWRLLVTEEGALKVTDAPASEDLLRLLHLTIKRVSDAMEHLSFNVAIAALIEFNNELVKRFGSDEASGSDAEKTGGVSRQLIEPLVLLLAPLAPHIAEELWAKLGHAQSLAYEPWPVHDPAMLQADTVEYPIQINGKLRGKITVPVDADEATVEAAVRSDEKIKQTLAGKSVKKVILVKGRMVNLVVG